MTEVLMVGVVADTHIPDRALEMHPLVLETLRKERVSLILHAGDISSPQGLVELEQIAPVQAVRGNRDLFFWPVLPLVRRLEINGVVVALMHGHGGWINYLRDKMVYLREGYRLNRYIPKLLNIIPEARVVVFGHTHTAENLMVKGRLIFNPGSANFGSRRGGSPSIGLLRIYPGSQVEGEIIPLLGYRLVQGRWQKETQP
jgi:putative phosphoesterase